MAYDSGYNPYIFNSNWRSLQIAFEQNVSVSASSTETVAHNLGFYPLTIVWYINSAGESMDNFLYFSPYLVKARFDTENVYVINSGSQNITASIKCYNVDISVPIEEDETTLKPSQSIEFDTSSIDTSIDMRNYILHSRCQSPAIFKIDANATGDDITYTFPDGYGLWAYGFYSPSGDDTKYECAEPSYNAAAPAFFQLYDKAIIWANTGSATSRVSLVILRDPLFTSTVVEASYDG
jgi:hypothetical protein